MWYLLQKTTDSTNFCTWLNVFSFCKKLVININKGKNKLIFENDKNQLRTLAAEYLLEFGDHIYEEMSEITPSFGSLSGYQVTNVSPKTIRFPLFWIFGYLFNNCIINNTGNTNQLEINTLDIEFTFREETTNQAEATRHYVSNTTANAYSISTCTFEDIHLEHHYHVIRDTRLASVRPSMEAVLFPIPELHVAILENKSMTAGDTVKFTLKDIAEVDNIQYLKITVQPVLSAYNSAESVKLYSGSNYLGFLISEIGHANKKKLDLTDPKLIEKYTIDCLRDRYGNLPPEIFTQSTNLVKYYIDTTYIFFDHNKIEPNHNELLTNMSSVKKDFEITLKCLSTISATSNIIITVFANLLNFSFNSLLSTL